MVQKSTWVSRDQRRELAQHKDRGLGGGGGVIQVSTVVGLCWFNLISIGNVLNIILHFKCDAGGKFELI